MILLVLLLVLLTACRQDAPTLPAPPPPVVFECPQPATPTPGPSPSSAGGVPYRLTWAGVPPDPGFFDAARVAAAEWNTALGFEVFSWEAGEGRIVFVTLERARISSPGGGESDGQTISLKGERLVRLNALIPDAFERVVVAHELGHVLGCAHSDNPADLMYRTTSNPLTPISPNDASAGLLAFILNR